MPVPLVAPVRPAVQAARYLIGGKERGAVEQTQPLVSYYVAEAANDASVKYVRVDGTRTIEAVEKEILSALS